MVVWRYRGNIIRTAACCVVYDSCAQRYAHKCEQFLNGRLPLLSAKPAVKLITQPLRGLLPILLLGEQTDHAFLGLD